MKHLVLLLTLLLPSTAFAEQQSSPSEQVLGQRLLREIQEGLNCSAALLTTKSDLAKAQARIKELETKYESPAKAK